MTLIDFNTRLTPTAQAVTTTAVTTDKYPLTQAGRDIFIGTPMALLYTVTVSALVAGTEEYTFQAVTATASDGTTGQRILASSTLFAVSGGSIAAGSLAAGQKIVVPIPEGRVASTATHFCGRILTANSAGITILCDFVPLSTVASFVTHAGRPSYPTGG